MIAVIWVRQEGRHECGEAEKKSVIIIDCTEKMVVHTRSSPLFFSIKSFRPQSSHTNPALLSE